MVRFLTQAAGEGGCVSTILISMIVGLLTFGLGLSGMYLQRLLPEQHLSTGSRELIGAVQGLVSLLLALVLGALVTSAYGFFATEKSNIEKLGAQSIQFDMALAQYGPGTQPIREGLKVAIGGAYHSIWGGEINPSQRHVRDLLPAFQRMNEAISALKAQTPSQVQLISTIETDARSIEQTRLLMSLQLASPVSWPLLVVVVSWAMLLFFGFGVLSRLNSTSISALALGAFAVGSAVFLVLELNQPFNGLFRVPGASVVETLSALGS